MLSLFARCSGVSRSPFTITIIGTLMCIIIYMYYLHTEMMRMDAKLAILSSRQHLFATAGKPRHADVDFNDIDDFTRMYPLDTLDQEGERLLSSIINPDGFGVCIAEGDICTIQEDDEGDEGDEGEDEVEAATTAGTPAETQAETPAETQAETPAETQAETPAETQAETPLEWTTGKGGSDALDSWKLEDLKRKLKELGADTKGSKTVLQQRLTELLKCA